MLDKRFMRLLVAASLVPKLTFAATLRVPQSDLNSSNFSVGGLANSTANQTVTSEKASSGGTTGLVVSTMQICIFAVLGPAIMVAGPSISRVVVLVQSAFATNYLGVVAGFSTVHVLTIFPNFYC